MEFFFLPIFVSLKNSNIILPVIYFYQHDKQYEMHLRLFHVSAVVHHHQIRRPAEFDNTLACTDDEINQANVHAVEWLHLNLENLSLPDAAISICLKCTYSCRKWD